MLKKHSALQVFRTSLLDTIVCSFSLHFGSKYDPKRPPNELKSSNFIDIWLKVLPLGSKMSILVPKGIPKGSNLSILGAKSDLRGTSRAPF